MGADGPALPVPWRLPVLALLLALLVWASDTNVVLFQRVNGVAPWLPAGGLLALTLWGNVLAAVMLVSGWATSRPRIIWSALFALLPGIVFVRGLKLLLALPRPAGVLGPDAITVVGPTYKAFAFPSGHTATAFAFAAIVYCLGGRRGLRWLAVAIAAAVGLSRVLVGAHWPVDVLVAAAGGWVCGYLGVWMASKYPWTADDVGRKWATAMVAACAVGLMFTRYDSQAEAIMGWCLAALGLTMALVAVVRRKSQAADDLGG